SNRDGANMLTVVLTSTNALTLDMMHALYAPCRARRSTYPHPQHRPHASVRVERAAEPSRCQFLLGEAAPLIALHMIAWGEATVCWIRRIRPLKGSDAVLPACCT